MFHYKSREARIMDRKAGRIAAALLLLLAAFPLFAAEDGKPRERFIKIENIKFRYLEAGQGDKTIVFVTGWTLTADVWQEQIPYFTARGFRVIAFDPRSHGGTTKTDTGNTFQQHAVDLYRFLLALKAEHSFLVGWSSGVTTLLEYVSSSDSIRPNKMILVDGAPAASKDGDYPGSPFLMQARAEFLRIQKDRIKAVEKYIQGLFRQQQSASLLKDLKKNSLKTPIESVVSLLFDWFTGDRRPALSLISVPTLIIATEENRAVGEYMKANITRSELKVIEGAGSAVFLEKPQAFNQAVEEFIGEE
jgi:non-heme chloroperoxidase